MTRSQSPQRARPRRAASSSSPAPAPASGRPWSPPRSPPSRTRAATGSRSSSRPRPASIPAPAPTSPTPRRSSGCPASPTPTSWRGSPTRSHPRRPPASAACRRSTWPHAAEYIGKLAGSRDLVLVEGAGGLLVRYDAAGATLADLAAMCGAPVLVVVAAGLGTLNHTALTCEALAARRLRLAGVVIGSWPGDPGLAERENLADLETLIGRPAGRRAPGGQRRADAARSSARSRGPGCRPALGGARAR